MPPILDAIIGLVFVILIFSLMVTSGMEVLAAFFSLRERNLKSGLDKLFASLGVSENPLSQSPLLKSLKEVSAASGPANIPSDAIAKCLLDTLWPEPENWGDFAVKSKSHVTLLKFIQVALLGVTLTDKTACLTAVTAAVESVKDQIRSDYQAKTRTRVFLLSLAMAAALNLDVFAIWHRITIDSVLTRSLVAAAESGNPTTQAIISSSIGQGIGKLDALGVPFGWSLPLDELFPTLKKYGSTPSPQAIRYAWFLKTCGILAMALAASLGAPFWFDTLQKFMSVRSTLRRDSSATPQSTAQGPTANTAGSASSVAVAPQPPKA